MCMRERVVYVCSVLNLRSCSRGVFEMAQKEEGREETRKREGDEARIDVVWRINFRLDEPSGIPVMETLQDGPGVLRLLPPPRSSVLAVQLYVEAMYLKPP